MCTRIQRYDSVGFFCCCYCSLAKRGPFFTETLFLCSTVPMTVSTTCKTVVLVPENSQSIHTHLFTRKYNSSWIRARDAFTIRLGYKIPFCYDDDAQRIVKKYIELQALRSTSHIIQNNGKKIQKLFFCIFDPLQICVCVYKVYMHTFILAYSIFRNNNFCTQSI